MLRKILFWIHLAFGCTAGLVILTMAFTGAMLAFEPQIVAFAERHVRSVVPSSPGAERMSLDALAAKARDMRADTNLSGVVVESDPAGSVLMMFGRGGAVYMNPYTGEVLGGHSKAHDIMHVIEDVHRRLAMKDVGEKITGAASIVFFFMILSGFYLWWPRAWSATKFATIAFFNFRLSGKARDFNWHNVIGFWAMPVLLVSTVTGIVMAYTWANNLVYRITGNEPPVFRSAAKGERPSPPILPTAPLDTLVASARSKVDGWVSITLRFPNREGTTMNAFVLEREGFGPPVRSQAVLDPVTGELKRWEPYDDANAGRKLRTWMRYLHTGDALGVPGQIIVWFGALAATLLVWTGLSLSVRRAFAALMRWRGR